MFSPDPDDDGPLDFEDDEGWSLVLCLSLFLLTSSTLHSVPARIMTCRCFRPSAISVVIWFLAILSSFTRSRHLSFGLPRFRFPSTVICNIFLCTCPNYLNLFSLMNSAIGYICDPSGRNQSHVGRVRFPLRAEMHGRVHITDSCFIAFITSKIC